MFSTAACLPPHFHTLNASQYQWLEMWEPKEGELSAGSSEPFLHLTQVLRNPGQHLKALDPLLLGWYLRPSWTDALGPSLLGKVMATHDLLSLVLGWLPTTCAACATTASRLHQGQAITSNDKHHICCRAWVLSALKVQCLEKPSSTSGAWSHCRSRVRCSWCPTQGPDSSGLLLGHVAWEKVEPGLSLHGVHCLVPEGKNCYGLNCVLHNTYVEALTPQCDSFWRWAFRR